MSQNEKDQQTPLSLRDLKSVVGGVTSPTIQSKGCPDEPSTSTTTGDCGWTSQICR